MYHFDVAQQIASTKSKNLLHVTNVNDKNNIILISLEAFYSAW